MCVSYRLAMRVSLMGMGRGMVIGEGCWGNGREMRIPGLEIQWTEVNIKANRDSVDTLMMLLLF